jgi:probable F420-dependent oxidoreductase
MRVGVIFPGFHPDAPSAAFHVEHARLVEQLGFDGLYAGDHLFGNTSNPDTLVILAAFAAATDRIWLGSAVLLLALREPALVAKQVATLDTLAPGRFVFGAGLGGEMEQEWAAMQVPLARRGRRLDEYLEILKLLWSGEPVDFAGEFRSISGVTGNPLPSRPGGPPVWIGGRSDAAVRRALRHDGWCAYVTSPRTLARRAAEIRQTARPGFTISTMVFTRIDSSAEAAAAAASEHIGAMYHQDFSELVRHVGAVGPAATVRDRLLGFATAGVDEAIVVPTVRPDELADQLTAIAAVAGEVRAAGRPG